MATDNENWTQGPLIPVSGIGSEEEAETRAASAFFAVLSIACYRSIALSSPTGTSWAGKATVETFIEPQFEPVGALHQVGGSGFDRLELCAGE